MSSHSKTVILKQTSAVVIMYIKEKIVQKDRSYKMLSVTTFKDLIVV